MDPNNTDIAYRCRCAGRDDRLMDGQLYLDAAAEIESLRQLQEDLRRRAKMVWELLVLWLPPGDMKMLLEEHPEVAQWFGGEDDRGDDTTDHHGNIPA